MTNLARSATVSLSGLGSPRKNVDTEILIGKDILELLTAGMYVDPLCVYREYVQNACDAIDEARQQGLYKNGVTPRIEMFFDQSERSVRIRDNGTGVSREHFVQILTAIGGSQKRGRRMRGFRGVGRLSGLGYCQELVFRSRSIAGAKIGEMVWSGRRLRDVLRNVDASDRLDDAIREVAQFTFVPATDHPEHFFEVELKKVARVRNDPLLHEEEVRSYLSQVAPVPFAPQLHIGDELQAFLNEHEVNSTYDIEINDGHGLVYRPHRDEFPITQSVADRFRGLTTFTINGIDGNKAAIGWILDHSYYGAIPKRTGVAGLRLRSGNIQVGSNDIVASHFPEPRFNSWCVGELHIVSDKIVPNGRRDDFEPGAHYQDLLSGLSLHTHAIARTCRAQSIQRNRLRTADTKVNLAHEALALLNNGGAEEFIVAFVKFRVMSICDGLLRLSQAKALSAVDRELIAAQVLQLETALDKATKKLRKRSIFKGLNATKRVAYAHILKLLYELSPNVSETHDLCGRVVDALRRDLVVRKK